MVKACSLECALAISVKAREKRERADLRARKLAIKPLSKWLREAQAAFNAYIRARDHAKGYPCISCQRHHTGQYHAGHYLSRGAHPELRFNELNTHLQCSACNNHLSGNQVKYRVHLEDRIGREALAWLEGKHEPARYRIEDVKAIKAKYKAKLKRLTLNPP